RQLAASPSSTRSQPPGLSAPTMFGKARSRSARCMRTNRGPVINQTSRRDEPGAMVPYHVDATPIARRPPHGTRILAVGRARLARRPDPAPAGPAAARAAGGLPGSVVLEGVGDHDRATVAKNPWPPDGPGGAGAGDAPPAWPADRERALPDPPHVRAAPQSDPGDLAGADRLPETPSGRGP